MPEYRLASKLYVLPTPGGAYYAAFTADRDPARRLLFKLMQLAETPPLTMDLLRGWRISHDDHSIQELLFRMQSMGWIQGRTDIHRAPEGTLEDVLPGLLSNLSSANKALLADNTGFYVARYGYPHEAAEELSALSADLASLYERHRRLLYNNVGIPSAAWGIVDAAGNSQIGFWPLYIGTVRFVLAISGLPRLHQPAFTDLVWMLLMAI